MSGMTEHDSCDLYPFVRGNERMVGFLVNLAPLQAAVRD